MQWISSVIIIIFGIPNNFFMRQETIENYLKTIYNLSADSKSAVGNFKLAEKLGIKPASVTESLKKLHDLKYVVYEKSYGTRLTGTGAKLALDIYIHRLRSEIGAMVAVLGGVDALVFTAGVGENSAEVRAAVRDTFAFLGLRLDQGKNGQSALDEDISAPDATVRVLVIHAQEDWMIARECWNLVRTATASMGH